MVIIPNNSELLTLGDNASIVCEVGKRIILTTEDNKPPEPRKPRPSYTTVGDGMTTRNFKSYPYEKTLLALNTNEARLFDLILSGYDKNTGYSTVDMSACTPSEKTELGKGYKALKQRELVKRLKQKTYLINPCAKIHLTFYDALMEVWLATP